MMTAVINAAIAPAMASAISSTSAVMALDFARNFLAAMVNHLWQSTLYLLGAGVLILALKEQQARIRYAIWLSATAKFLLPFSAFIRLGGRLAPFHKAANHQAEFATVMRYAGRSFAPAEAESVHVTYGLSAWLPVLVGLLWLFGCSVVLAYYLRGWNAVRLVARKAVPMDEGREADALRTAARRAALRSPVRLLLSSGATELGVIGVRRPALLFPERMTTQLDDAHLDAIMLHEAWHVRRHDNLTAMLQMWVEGMFWFHPLVWWLGGRLLEERERACDEAVLAFGSDPRVYAESILQASKFCVESPLACVSGVTGADLQQRMVRIMTQQRKINLSLGAKLCFSALGAAVIAVPIVSGVLTDHRVLAAVNVTSPADFPPLEKSTIRPARSGEENDRLYIRNGGLTYSYVTVKQLILFAYDLKGYQLTGAPAWINGERYDVEASWRPLPVSSAPVVARLPSPPGALVQRDLLPLPETVPLLPGQLQAIIRSILATRFGLQLGGELKSLPGFVLEASADGAKLPKPIAPSLADDGEQIMTVREMSKGGKEELGQVGPLAALADQISMRLKAPVTDKTRLAGTYDVTLKWTDAGDRSENIRTALQQQLGLELSPNTTPVEMLAVQRIKQPALD